MTAFIFISAGSPRKPAIVDSETGLILATAASREAAERIEAAINFTEDVALLNAAVATLDSDCGVASMGELAAAVKAAGGGDFTDEFPVV